MKRFWYILFCLLLIAPLSANDLSITNTSLQVNPNTGWTYIQFDISWDNSWRSSSGASNWDAAWVFVKYRVGNGEWQHSKLSPLSSDHFAPGGSSIFSTADSMGAFIYRDTDGTGSINFSSVQLAWDFATAGLTGGENIEFKVLGIEMVYVPQGVFWLGDGASDNTFRQSGSNLPVQITPSESTVLQNSSGIQAGDAILESGVTIDGDDGICTSGIGSVDNPDYPTGLRSFYCMKYEASQGQYATFLNMLTPTQAAARYDSNNGGVNRYSLSGTHPDIVASAPDRACNFVSVDDMTAYADWAGLRPMTELEYEKAARGPSDPVENEYAWGNTNLFTDCNVLSNDGLSNEIVSSGANIGNCTFKTNNADCDIKGPLRCGIFAASATNYTREESGSGYYGIMELSGNLREMIVSIGREQGRLFTGLHGNGDLTTSGMADVDKWPSNTNLGIGYRGGSWQDDGARLKVSDRLLSGDNAAGVRSNDYGIRCVRVASTELLPISLAPTVTTNSASDITSTAATVGGDVSDDGGDAVSETGIYYSLSADAETTGTKIVIGNGSGVFSTSLTGLAEGTTYYIKAYATNSIGTSYGTEENFTTSLTVLAPTVTTNSSTDITSTSATVGGEVTNDGGAAVSETGIYYSLSADAETTGTKLAIGSGSGVFSNSLTGLTAGTTYYIKAYATNSIGTSYGTEESFATSVTVLAPTVTTNSSTDITSTSATVGGEVTNDGGAAVSETGIYYSLSADAETTGTKLAIGSGSGVFSNSLTGLTAGTTYYIKAYATNSIGTSYGTEESFATSLTVLAPTVTTNSAADINTSSATVGGNVTNDGGDAVSETGIYYSLSADAETTGTKIVIGSGTGVFSTSLTGLTAGTTYYIKAYATNSIGTSYGTEESFATSLTVLAPTVTTNSATDINTTSATVGGNVTNDGGNAVTENGVYYSLSADAKTTGTKLAIGSGAGAYSTSLTGLSEGTTYYIKAYATNSAGISYGVEQVFNTLLDVPILNSPSDGSTVGSNITFIWSSISGATSYDIQFDAGTGWEYTENVTETNLAWVGGEGPHTWQVRAKNTTVTGAWSSPGTYTVIVAPAVTTGSVTDITSTSATVVGEVTSDGGSIVTENGIYYSTSSNPETTGTKLAIGTGSGAFSSSLTGLNGGSTYYIKAYAMNSEGVSYGSEQVFNTLLDVPILSSPSDGSTVGSNITFVWSSISGATSYDMQFDTGTGWEYTEYVADTTLSWTGGEGVHTWQVRAKNSIVTGDWSSPWSYTVVVSPTVTTSSATNIASTSATVGGEVSSEGEDAVTESGIYYSLTANAETTGTKHAIGSGIGVFSNSLSGLTEGTTYYIKAFATNSFGTSYGAEETFTTLTTPTVTTSSAADITSTSTTIGGEVTADGGDAVTDRGIYYSTSANAETTGTKLAIGSGSGVFSTSLTGLLEFATYYIKAYATNGVGTAYGDELSFMTIQIGDSFQGGIVAYILQAGDPGYLEEETKGIIAAASDQGQVMWYNGTYTTTDATGIAIGTGSDNTIKIIDSQGDYGTYAARICNEYINDSYCDWYLPSQSELNKLYLSQTEIGGFVASNYWSSSEYNSGASWYQSFSTGEQSVYFGKYHDFYTRAIRIFSSSISISAPTLTTSSLLDIASTSVTVGGDVTSDGGDGIVERGVYYSTSPNAETTGTKLAIGVGTGTYSTSLTGLDPETTYYIRAYAFNSSRISYGLEESFTTLNTPTLTTSSATDIASTSATIGGEITSDGGDAVTERGVYYSTTADAEITGTKLAIGSATGVFSSNLASLTPGTTYYIKAYATNAIGTSYGNEITFNTLAILPTLSTTAITSITANTASSGGNITDDGGGEITARGVCWSTSVNPTISDSTTTDGTGSGTFTSSISGLVSSTTYYVKAYATNSAGTAYGNELTFTSLTAPTVITADISDTTSTAAVSGGNVTASGGAPVISIGVCWSTAANPTIDDFTTTDGSGTGSYISNISGLTPGTTYYLRAYATSTSGTGYGEEKSFITFIEPTVATADISAITSSTATGGGEVTFNGNTSIIERGICWSTSQNPTISGNKTSDGSGIGTYTSSMTGLAPNTIYYVRAYSTNSVGTSYGEEKSFTTEIALPTLTTTSATNITINSASSGGTITSDGGDAITVSGICWSTNPNPTLSDSQTSDGTGSGAYASELTGLTIDTDYYVRAYAINSAGTGYGDEVIFTSRDGVATIITTEISEITMTTASTGGNITDDGGTPILAKGIVWSTNPGPTLDDQQSFDGTGADAFNRSLSGLSSETTYYVRAYASNIIGISYGNEIILKTMTGTVTDIDGNLYYTVAVGSQVWMAENLKTTHYNDGSAIPYITDNTAWANLADNNTDDAYCYYNNNSSSEYGALYTYAAALNACPAGWHLPSDAEWTELENYLADNGYNYDGTTGGGGDKIAKAMATASGWNSSSTTGAVGNNDYPDKPNASGFSALPGGFRSINSGTFYYASNYGYWWSSTEYSSSIAYYRILYYSSANVGRINVSKSSGFSVRCIKDKTPTVTTQTITGITSSSATSGGEVLYEGDAEVTARGVCWSTTENPTIADSITTDSTGIGTFLSSLTDLSPNTTYYVRAYVTNSYGTGYGGQKSFTTFDGSPIVITNDAIVITANSAKCGGEVVNDWGYSITERGICWSRFPNPTSNDYFSNDGTGLGNFISTLTGLSSNTKYYIRAYATNSVGTAYGNELTFTSGDEGVLTDSRDGNQYEWIKIGSQIWMAENLAYLPSVQPSSSQSTTSSYYYVYDYQGTSVSAAKATANYQTYGTLYNSPAALNACPEGWHLPTEAEWTELLNLFASDGFSESEATALKTTTGWYSNGNGTDDYGFSVIPAGYRYNDTFYNEGSYTFFWTSTLFGLYTLCHQMGYDTSNMDMALPYERDGGFSVRCVKN